MEHRDARSLASRSLDDGLPEAQEKELAVHLVSCAECKTFFEGLSSARAAISRLAEHEPSEATVDAAVWRATTVLGGEADPGPLEGHEDTGPMHLGEISEGPDTEAPIQIPEPQAPAESADEGPPEADETLVAGPSVPTDQDDFLPASPSLDAEPEGVVGPGPLAPDHTESLTPPPRREETSTHPPLDDLEVPESVMVPTAAGEPPSADVPWPEPESSEAPVATEEPDDGPLIHEERQPRLRPRVGPLIIGLSVTVGVVVLVVMLILQGTPLGNGVDTRDLPSAGEVRQGVAGAFDELQTLRTTFRITRLGLYRVGVEEDTVTYSFSNGMHSGDIVYEIPNRLREERTIEVPENPTRRLTVVRGPDELRTLEQVSDDETFTILENPPYGPPDSDLHAPLGSLEYAIGSAAKLLTASDEVTVVERTAVGDREAYRVRFAVRPSPFTRADRIEILVDSASYFPLAVIRSLDRAEAGVLVPPEVPNDEPIEAAYGDRDRIVTERVELTDLIVNDVVLPGRFGLEVPEDVEPDESDAEFVAAEEIDDVPDEVGFDPLTPASVPRGYRERGTVVFTGDPQDWGPEEDYPAPEGILQSLYSDGRTSIVLSQRAIDDGPFDIEGSPLLDPGLPVITNTEVRGGQELTYAISPETPPHVFGFIGDIFVMAVGYAPQEDLIRLAASLSEGVPQTPEETPSRLRTPEPTPERDSD